MASLKEMRNRISSVKATQKITKALQMVAAAKLRGATEAAERARPYARRMASVIANLAASVSGPSAPKLLIGTGSDKTHLVIVATADRGLAGGFNSSIARLAREHIATLLAQGKTVRVITIGRKARDQVRRLYGQNIVESVEAGKTPGLGVAQGVADRVLAMFEAGEFDVATLIYSRFKSVVTQTPTLQQLIPAEVDPNAPPIDLGGAAYEYEPDEETILATLLPRNIAVQILGALYENNAGFYAAQMSAMDSATRNAGDMIAKMTLLYNRSRQAQITKELIEIISGAEAL
ncbi:MAG TPA: F0F1 ATP synthase subunit gamma [Caulobacteraceae bacterium]|jgi:F-type H+-transporting ATPase subunit gamma|nr:F0F1 ATP synthase subunit gamma [Caulobacteraceae bacterium]